MYQAKDHTLSEALNAITISDDEDESPGIYPDGFTICWGDPPRAVDHHSAIFDTAKEFLQRNTEIEEKVTKAKAYVVFNGRELGIFTDGASCQKATAGYHNCSFQSYKSIAAAQKAWDHAVSMGNIGSPRPLPTSAIPLRPVFQRQKEAAKPPSTPPVVRKQKEPVKLPSTPPVASSSRPTNAKAEPNQPIMPIPSIPEHSVQMPGFMTPHRPSAISSDLKYASTLTDDELFWVVVQGAHPGVYHGKKGAMKATRYSSKPIVQCALSYNEVCQIFVKKYMAEEVREV